MFANKTSVILYTYLINALKELSSVQHLKYADFDGNFGINNIQIKYFSVCVKCPSVNKFKTKLTTHSGMESKPKNRFREKHLRIIRPETNQTLF